MVEGQLIGTAREQDSTAGGGGGPAPGKALATRPAAGVGARLLETVRTPAAA